ncbi:MAG TPA: hypothetical protein VJ521_06755 [Acidobacteriota bacterium]|nr:hypothetical protein [Acidobacteriota bacterium]
MLRWSLILGGLFNFVMGFVFFSNELMEQFFHIALRLETMLFSQSGVLVMPQDELHLLLIHGFGAAAMILGATLIYSARDAVRFLPFIFIDGIGRFVFGTLMLVYVFRYQLPRVIVLFAFLELAFAMFYITASLQKRKT